MAPPRQAVTSNLVRFGGEFELDRGAFELRKAGRRRKLARIPMELLLLLLERPGQLVTREQIAERLWGKDVFLDIDNGINAVVRRIRQVLEDDAEEPRFIETVVGRGYRFVAPVQEVAPPPGPVLPDVPPAQTETHASSSLHHQDAVDVPASPSPSVGMQSSAVTIRGRSRWMVLAGAAAFVLAILALFAGRWFGGSTGHVDSIAVLPFVNAGGDPDVEYLSDGMTEDIIRGLSQLPQMRVMARSTVFHYKGRDIDPRRVGHDLAVRAVLTGTLARHGDDLRIQSELMDVSNGSVLWSEQYDRRISDTAAVQQEVVRDISEKLQLRSSAEVTKKLRQRNTESWEAYDLYLRGRYQWNKFTDESLQKAIGYFQQAIDKDPNYALAYAGLADSYHELAYTRPPREVMPKAAAAAGKALQLDDSVAEAHAALGWVKWQYDWDWNGAEKEFKRSIELSPDYAIAHGMYALYLDSMSRVDEAMAQHKRARELEPLSLIININMGEALYETRRYDQAIEQYRKTLEIDSNFALAHDDLADVFHSKGMYREAVAEWQKSLIARGDSGTAAAIGQAYSKAGYKGACQTILTYLTSPPNHSYSSPLSVAKIYAQLGETDRAFEWLAKAYQDRSSDLVFFQVQPAFDNLRADPRYAELERTIGFSALIPPGSR
jgi:TolB-like protein/DNA-binding winged helix-turn-helix (wHTH) protein/Tfp pilus assembly protein PilF